MKLLAALSTTILIIASLFHFLVLPDPEKDALEAGHKAYMEGRYEAAIDSYELAGSDPLLLGNAYFRLHQAKMEAGTAAEGPDNKAEASNYYKQAIGESAFDVLPKYNYEYINQEEESENSSEEDSEDESEDQDSEGKESDQEDESEENDPRDSQEEDSEQESEEGDSSDEDETEETSDESQDGELDENADTPNEPNDQDGTEETEANPVESDVEEAYQILELLEQQEEESLKNNHNIDVNTYKGEGNDW